MKKLLAVFLCAVLLFTGVIAQAGEAFVPEAFKDAIMAELTEYYASVAPIMTLELSEDSVINISMSGAPVGAVYFDHVNEDGTVNSEGQLNHLSLLLLATGSDEDSIKAYLALYGVLTGIVKHILYPETDMVDCAKDALAGLQDASNSGEENTRTKKADNGAYCEEYGLSALSEEMIMLSYQAKVISLD